MPAGCLFCTRPVTAGQPRCPALEAAGVAAHACCCGGCAHNSTWLTPARDVDAAADPVGVVA
jgi:hypothetical protein